MFENSREEYGKSGKCHPAGHQSICGVVVGSSDKAWVYFYQEGGCCVVWNQIPSSVKKTAIDIAMYLNSM